jgi:hypothetical protein
VDVVPLSRDITQTISLASLLKLRDAARFFRLHREAMLRFRYERTFCFVAEQNFASTDE